MSEKKKKRISIRRQSDLRLGALPLVVTELEEKIRTLSADDKIELMRALIAELDSPADADVERVWLEEARRRHREITEGKVEPVPGERVFENLRSRLER